MAVGASLGRHVAYILAAIYCVELGRRKANNGSRLTCDYWCSVWDGL